MQNQSTNILIIETSGKTCSAAISVDGLLAKESVVEEEHAHSRLLAPMVNNLLNQCNISTTDLDAVAISAGPGSYTGLRIGASLAKGICYPFKLPLIAISTLDGIASIFTNKAEIDVVCSMIDARRMDAYVAAYSKNHQTIFKEQFITIESSSFNDILDKHQVLFCGDGSLKASEIIHHKNAEFNWDRNLIASDLSAIANQKLANKDFEDIAYFEPNYIKSVYINSPKQK